MKMDGSWKHWEMHPAGDEVVVLLSGAMDFTLEIHGTGGSSSVKHHIVELRGRGTLVVPQGVWHTANST